MKITYIRQISLLQYLVAKYCRSLFVIIITLSVFLLSSCDLFEARTAEAPNDSNVFIGNARTANDLILNFTKSIQCLDANGYVNCLVDTMYYSHRYEFQPSSSSYSVFIGWDKKNEKNLLYSVRSKVKKDSIVLLEFANQSMKYYSDSVVYIADYKIRVPFSDASLPKDYIGKIQLLIIKDNLFYYVIRKWSDFKTEHNNSWTELKASL